MLDRSKGDQVKEHPSADKMALPSIVLPKGGGAIRSVGEKFTSSPATGAGSMSVPICTSSGRSGFEPTISLSYNSGSGNGPFGFGWSLSLGAITRKTDKGLPKYDDFAESDTFLLSGAEDLVPLLVFNSQNNLWQSEEPEPRTLGQNNYLIRQYRPRVEGSFARIERWANAADMSDAFWRTISHDNITSLYGLTADSRIADPFDSRRIFSWLICQSYDDKGNVIAYGYKREDSNGIDTSQAHERNRTNQSRSANLYLKRIRYGNRHPYLPVLSATAPWPVPNGATAVDGSNDWCFELVLDYGEHDQNNPLPQEGMQTWTCRNDPFSSYRPGFEVRTSRLCQRFLMFHHFALQPTAGVNCLVHSTDLNYSYEADPTNSQNPIFTNLIAVNHCGYGRQADGSFLKKSMPALEFGYSPAVIDSTVRTIDPGSLQNIPSGLSSDVYQWVDLDGEGVSGIITEQANGWFYKRNLSPANVITEDGVSRTSTSFGALETLPTKPLLSFERGRAEFLSLAGDGRTDLVDFQGPLRGFYKRNDDSGWEPFLPFQSFPDINHNDANMRFVDLNGDGLADILISEDQVFRWHPSLGEVGFGPAEFVRKPFDEEVGPALILADPEQSIFLADMSGDGLNDLVRIRNNEVCYWPNLGYGRFGAKIGMDNAPCFDTPELFDQRRIRLGDINGSGTIDIIYLADNHVAIYFNQSGNAWSVVQRLTDFPQTDQLASITVTDLLGIGTACLVWSSPLPNASGRQMRYIDLMGGLKPHLLIRTSNNMGAETLITYAASTKFYVEDKLAGNPWLTKLPFPVQVVERVDSYDYISRNRFAIRYAYHHGYYDGVEREFGGFGRVEQWDTEDFASLAQSNDFMLAANIDDSSNVPPVLTKTWFHTGAFFDGAQISQHMASEYYVEDDTGDLKQPGSLLLPDSLLPTSCLLTDSSRVPYQLKAEEAREACRALRGSILRQEIYAIDGTAEATLPYSTSERNYNIEILQPQGENFYAAFTTHARESIDCHYERQLFPVNGDTLLQTTPVPANASYAADPRVTHSLTLAVDYFGNVLQMATVGYGRRYNDLTLNTQEQLKQKTTAVVVSEHSFTKAISSADVWRTPALSETNSFELINVLPKASQPTETNLFAFDELTGIVTSLADGKHDIPYENITATGTTPGQAYRRLLRSERFYYRPDDMGAAANNSKTLLTLGELESLALPGTKAQLALTPGLLQQVYKRNGEDLLTNWPTVLAGQGASDGGYLDLDNDGNWWITAPRSYYHTDSNATPQAELTEARQHFFQSRRLEDPFGQISTVSFDTDDLLAIVTTDAVNNTITSVNDYRVLKPALINDENDNRTMVSFDALGLVAGIAVMGKTSENKGDSLDNFDADLTTQQITDFYQASNPAIQAQALLANATSRFIYDIDLFGASRLSAPDDFRQWQPNFTANIVRETHASDLAAGQTSKLQISFSTSDGFGREVQKKVQAAPGPVPARDASGNIIVTNGLVSMTTTSIDPRWIGTGWVIYNNKGKAIQQFEPFFTDSHKFEFDVRIGVSPISFYDPLGRLVAKLYPDHTWEKVIFDSWKEEHWDSNDTVLISDPAQDVDVGSFFSRLPSSQYLPTWFMQRQNGALGAAAEDAAQKTSIHASTPGTFYLDALSHKFLAIAHNRYKRSDSPASDPPIEDFQRSLILFDVQGNELEIRDAMLQGGDAEGRIVVRSDFEVLGGQIHHISMEAAERWTLKDVAGKIIRAWDSRGYQLRTEFDAIRRPIAGYVSGGNAADLNSQVFSQEVLYEKTVYGDSLATGLTLPQQQISNLRGKIFVHFDNAGAISTDLYDFKGNPLTSSRQYVTDYKNSADWSKSPALETDIFETSSAFDALNRPISVHTPDTSIYSPTYDSGGYLSQVNVNQRGAATATNFVSGIDHDAKGQRTLINYGNGASTTYSYDRSTFRLINLKTTRPAGGNGVATQIFTDASRVQDLNYTYDAIGNIVQIVDAALLTQTYNNQQVTASCLYTYDALYRLIEATGREHVSQSAFQFTSTNDSYRDYPFVGNAHPNDLTALRNYIERFDYDTSGNFAQVAHQTPNGNWTNTYTFGEASLIESTKMNNRLSHLSINANGSAPSSLPFAYDVHGNATKMSHLPLMQWNFKDQLSATAKQVVNNGTPETTYYVYDGSGQRARKVTENQNGTLKNERLYLNGFEVYREYLGSVVSLERQSLHIVDNKTRIALVETQTVANSTAVAKMTSTQRYQLDNHLGSASLELDETGSLISYEEYTPYGNTSFQAGRNAAEVNSKRYRYTSKERDEETGFNYHGARYYAPWLGRWVSCDPLGVKDGPNLYVYAASNPICHIDPSGTAAVAPNPEPVLKSTGSKLIGDYPGFANLWEKAANKVLGNDARFAGKTFKENIQKFQTYIEGLEKAQGTLGSNRQAGTAIGDARRIYSRVRTEFGVLAEAAGVSLKGVQVHHGIGEAGELAQTPKEALNAAALHLAHGHAASAGTEHNLLHELNKKLTAAATQKLQTASTQVAHAAAPAKSVTKNLTSRAGQRGAAGLGLISGIAHVGVAGAFGLLSYKSFKEDVKNKDYGSAIASGAGVVEGVVSIGARVAVAAGAAPATVAMSTSVSAMGTGEAIAAAPHIVGAFAAGAAIGVGIEYVAPSYTQHAANMGTKVHEATGSLGLGGVVAAASVIPIIWGATKAYSMATSK